MESKSGYSPVQRMNYVTNLTTHMIHQLPLMPGPHQKRLFIVNPTFVKFDRNLLYLGHRCTNWGKFRQTLVCVRHIW